MSTASNQTSEDHSIVHSTVLHENDLTEESKKHFGFHSDVLRVLEAYRQSILGNEHITHGGRHFFLSELHSLHTNFKHVLNYAAEHNRFLDQNLPSTGPLVIGGLLRTGTTLLHNLLACDPNCRAPLYTDMCIEVVPPIARSDAIQQKRRIDLQNSSQPANEQLVDLLVRIAAAHARFPISEDYHILRQGGYLPLFTFVSDDEESDAKSWIHRESGKDYAYDYHEIFLRMLNSVDMPKSHWLLKAPVHILYFDQLLRHYPNALLIMTHRRLEEVFPSACSMSLVAAEVHFEKTNTITRNRIIKRSCQFIDTAIECIVKFRTSHTGVLRQSEKNIFDLEYDNLMKDPIGVVHQIYDYFNLRWSGEFEQAMRKWLLENPQGKQGRHTYSLDEFGLNLEDMETRHAEYISLFLSSKSADCPSPPADSVVSNSF